MLEAGASVAQVYTTLVYGGVGTIARMKDEMREEMEEAKGGGFVRTKRGTLFLLKL